MENKMENQMEIDNMFNTPDYESLEYLFNTILKYIHKPNDFDKPYAIISAMQIQNFIVTTHDSHLIDPDDGAT
tara:strand:- start:264 stop:482 length:219 start_codon:yes stop_codon:yes gene_type:complete